MVDDAAPMTPSREGRAVVSMRDIRKTYMVKPPVPVLHGVDLDVYPGETLAIVGDSGAGKSTLLNIMGLLDEASSGTYLLDGTDVATLSDRRRDAMRAHTLGFVFQDYHILSHRSVEDNLQLKLAISRVPTSEREAAIEAALDDVGLGHRRHSMARLLSGGEKQRLSIARAIITHPVVLLADEPTGNLDPRNAHAVLELFSEQAARGVAVVVITHDDRVAAWASRTVRLTAGRCASGEMGEPGRPAFEEARP